MRVFFAGLLFAIQLVLVWLVLHAPAFFILPSLTPDTVDEAIAIALLAFLDFALLAVWLILEAYFHQRAEMEQKIKDLTHEDRALTEGMAIVTQNLAQAETDNVRLRTENARLEKREGELEKDVTALKESNGKLETENDGLKKQKTGLERYLAAREGDVATLKHDVAASEEDNASLKERLGRLEMREIASAKKIQALEAQNMKLRCETEATERTQEKCRKQIKELRAKAIDDRKAWESEVAEAAGECEAVLGWAEVSENSHRQRLANKAQEAEFQAELDAQNAAEQEAAHAETRRALEASQGKLEAERKAHKKTESARKEWEDHAAQLKFNYEKWVEKYGSDYREWAEKVKKAEHSAKKLGREKSDLESALSGTRKELEDLKTSTGELEARNKLASVRIEEVGKKCEEMESQSNEYAEKIGQLEQQIENSSEAYQALKQEAEDRERTVTVLKGELEGERKSSLQRQRSADNEAAALRSKHMGQLIERENRIAELESQLTQLQKAKETAQADAAASNEAMLATLRRQLEEAEERGYRNYDSFCKSQRLRHDLTESWRGLSKRCEELEVERDGFRTAQGSAEADWRRLQDLYSANLCRKEDELAAAREQIAMLRGGTRDVEHSVAAAPDELILKGATRASPLQHRPRAMSTPCIGFTSWDNASQQLMVSDDATPRTERPNTPDSGYSTEPRHSSRAPSPGLERSSLEQTSKDSPAPTLREERDNNFAQLWENAIEQYESGHSSPTEEQSDPNSTVTEKPNCLLEDGNLPVDAAAPRVVPSEIERLTQMLRSSAPVPMAWSPDENNALTPNTTIEDIFPGEAPVPEPFDPTEDTESRTVVDASTDVAPVLKTSGGEESTGPPAARMAWLAPGYGGIADSVHAPQEGEAWPSSTVPNWRDSRAEGANRTDKNRRGGRGRGGGKGKKGEEGEEGKGDSVRGKKTRKKPSMRAKKR